jgi:poly(3-hydroxyalkanoate) synthetase
MPTLSVTNLCIEYPTKASRRYQISTYLHDQTNSALDLQNSACGLADVNKLGYSSDIP